MGKKKMQWEVRSLDDGRWGIFLKQEFCRTDELVCYGAGKNKISIERSCERLNTETDWDDEQRIWHHLHMLRHRFSVALHGDEADSKVKPESSKVT